MCQNGINYILPLISTAFLMAFIRGIGVGLEIRLDFGTILTKL